MKSKQKPTSRRRFTKTQAKRKPRASNTSEILGSSGSARKGTKIQIERKWSAHYRHLQELRDELLVQSGKLAKEVTEGLPTYSMHMADAGTDSFDRDFALSVLSSDQEALYEINEALRRIETGSYGVCELSGKRIPQKRLQVIPWTRFSASAQRQLERDGTLKHRQLSAVGSLPAIETEEGDDAEEEARESA